MLFFFMICVAHNHPLFFRTPLLSFCLLLFFNRYGMLLCSAVKVGIYISVSFHFHRKFPPFPSGGCRNTIQNKPPPPPYAECINLELKIGRGYIIGLHFHHKHDALLLYAFLMFFVYFLVT